MKKKIRIPTTLNILLVSFVLLIALVLLYSVYLSNRLLSLSFQIYNHPFVVTNEIKDINIYLNKIVNVTDRIAYDYTSDINGEIAKINEWEDVIEKSIDVVKEKFIGNKELVFEAEKAFDNYKSILRKNLLLKIKNDQMQDLVLQEEKLVDFKNSLELVYKNSINNASALSYQIDAENNVLIKSLYGFLFVMFVYCLGFLFVINSKIKRPLSKIIKRIEGIFDDDVTKTDEIHKISDIELLVMTIEYLENIRDELKNEISIKSITENKLTIINDQMKNTMLSKDKLFSIIAHDLINPFQSIIGFSQYLIDNQKSIPTKEYEELLILIKEAAINQHSLLKNLLNWSKSQIGELEIKKELINVYRFVEEVFLNVSLVASSKSIVLINATDPEKFIYSDKRILVVTLDNLIINAIKFSYPENNIIVSFTEDNLYKIIKVQDFGCGISNDKIKNIFNISNKDINTGTGGEKGSGLGLLICKEYISKQGGKIWVESEINIGSTFFVALPKEIFQKSNLSFS